MKCNKCNVELKEDSKFCPYCGTELNKENGIKYKDDIKPAKVKVEYKEETKEIVRDNKCLVGLILGIASIPATIFNVALGIPLAIIAFILVIIGFKHTTKGLSIASLIITIMTLVISTIISVFIIVGNIKITLSNGYTVSIKNYIIDAFNCGYYKHTLSGYWTDSDKEIFYLDKNGNYYIYTDSNDITDNYYYGEYTTSGGKSLTDGEKLFGDDNYYYYRVNTSNNHSKITGELSTTTLKLLENGFSLKLDKSNRNRLVLESKETNTEIELNRQD